MKSRITTKELTRIAFMGCLLFCVFQGFANILYLEMMSFTIVIFCMLFPRREAVLACVIFAMMNMLLMGITPWTLAYLLIYTTYASIRFYYIAAVVSYPFLQVNYWTCRFYYFLIKLPHSICC